MQDWSEIRVVVGENSEMTMSIHTFASQLHTIFKKRNIISFCPAYNMDSYYNMTYLEANDWCRQQFALMNETDSEEEFSDSDDEYL